MTPTDENWLSNVEPLQQVEEASDIKWDSQSDVVIIGVGGAGISAALQANELGLSVTAVDRFHGGGATQASGGVIYAGGGTSVQIDAGVDDDPDNMFRYLQMETQGIVSDATLRDFCDRSPETIDWLKGHGVEFRAKLWKGKTSYPNVDYFLYHSDNSLVPAYKKNARPAARGHRGYVPPEEGIKAVTLGGSIYNPMRMAAEKLGTRILEQTEARQLICDASGRVIGVKVLKFPDGSKTARLHQKYRGKAARLQLVYPPILPGYSFVFKRAMAYMHKARELEDNNRQTLYIRATRGVVIAAGGFVFNQKMIKHYAPAYLKGYPLGTDGDDGAGIRLGQSARGITGNMQRISPWRFINPPLAFAQGIIVNKAGERYIDEMVYGATLGSKMVEEHSGHGWIILDKTLIKEALSQVKGGKVLPFQRDLARLNIWFAAKKAKSLDALADKINIDAEGLNKSISTYNEAAINGAPDSMGKNPDDLHPITKPPFYAINIGLGAKLFPCPTLTLGGLLVDEATGEVLEENGTCIKGLYAAGRTAVGICSHHYVSGLSIADCIYSGRRAARHLAQQSKQPHDN